MLSFLMVALSNRQLRTEKAKADVVDMTARELRVTAEVTEKIDQGV